MKNSLTDNRFKTVHKDQNGQMLMIAVVVIGFVLVNTLLIISGAMIFSQSTNYRVKSSQALNLAEAGVDKALASLNATGGNYSGEQETFIGEGSYSVSVLSEGNIKTITATGYIPSRDNPDARRTITVMAALGAGIAFNYGIQVGDGGLEMNNHNTINGSIYSNGNIITGSNNNRITGDIWVAGGVESEPNQQTDCIDISCDDFIFGRNVNGDNRLDVAQSFRPSITEKFNKFSIKLKKFGNPSNVTVRVMGDNNGSPSRNSVLASGTLNSSLVTSEYGWIDVSMTTSPTLNANTNYWLMIDTSSDSNNYWSWQKDLNQSYTLGQPKWSPNWNTGNPTWNTFSPPGDLSFRAYPGGGSTFVNGNNGLVVEGDARANTIRNMMVNKDAYYQVIENTTVVGTSYPGSSDPPSQTMPVSDANISEWKQAAEDFSSTTGNITSCPGTLGPGKIIGNIDLSGCTVTIGSPIWVTGNFILSNGNTFRLSTDYGASSGVIVVDGITEFGNNNSLEGSGSEGSVLMVLSTYDSKTTLAPAISIKNTGNNGQLYAGEGIIEVSNNNSFKELTAWRIVLNNNITLNYETGLANTFFSSGPSGAYSLIRNTYRIE
jgi:hypothetical protein